MIRPARCPLCVRRGHLPWQKLPKLWPEITRQIPVQSAFPVAWRRVLGVGCGPRQGCQARTNLLRTDFHSVTFCAIPRRNCVRRFRAAKALGCKHHSIFRRCGAYRACRSGRHTGYRLFQSPTTIVTIEHVATAMGLSTQDWKPIDIKGDGDSQLISARIKRWVEGGTEKLAVLELQAAISTARSVEIRMAPLVADDRVVTLAYANQSPRFVSGRFVKYHTDGRLEGAALLEMYEGDNRLAIDHGASGAPVFDCEGQVAAVISNVITQTLSTPFGQRRISTAWGSPNVVSVPVQKLMEFSEAR
jgi:hypothetical protein